MAAASTFDNQSPEVAPDANRTLPSRQPLSRLRLAVTQAEPGWLNLRASVDKTCSLIAEAAEKGAQLLAFPECWITGYPAWIWTRPVDPDLVTQYIKNSLRVDSPEMQRICESAEKHGMVVVLGFSERSGDSLYISQAIIDGKQHGRIVLLRRKLKPTHMERTIFGDASPENLNGVVDTSIGRVGALACWEHIQPLLKYHTYSQRVQVHVAAWPPLRPHQGHELWSMSKEGTRALSQTYAIEAQAFVLHSTAVIKDAGIALMRTGDGVLFNKPGGGTSAIFGPDGMQITEDLNEEEEGIIFADIDLDDILKTKSFVDLCGHYSRPDLLWLGVDSEKKPHVRFQRNEQSL